MSELTVSVRLKADGSGLVGEIRMTRKELDALGVGANQTRGQMQRLGDEGEQSSKKLRAGFDSVRVGIASLGIGLMVRELSQISDRYAGIDARLRLVTDSSEEFAAAQGELFDIAQRTGSSYEAVAGLYTKVARNADALGLSQQKLFTFTEATNQAMQVSGAASSEAAAGTQQLAQALASGVLRGDELNSIMENTPRVAQAIADGLRVPIGSLREMAAEGKLTADIVTQAILDQSATINAEFDQLPETISRSLTRIENDFQRTIASSDTKPIVDGLTELRETLNDPAIKEGLITLAGGLATATGWAVKLAGAVGTAGTSIGELVGELATGETTFERFQTWLLLANPATMIQGMQRLAQDTARTKAEFEGAAPSVANFSDALDLSIDQTELQAMVNGALVKSMAGLNAADEERKKAAEKASQAVAAANTSALQHVASLTRENELIRDGTAADEAAFRARSELAGISLKAIEATIVAQRENAALKKTQDDATTSAKQLEKAIEAVGKAALQESLTAIRDEAASLAEVQNLKDQLQLMRDGVSLEDAAFQIKLKSLEASGQIAAADAERYRAQIKSLDDAGKAVEDFLSLNVGGDFAAGFDEASAALGTFVDRFDQLVDVQSGYDAARAAAGKDAVALAKIETKYQNDQIKLYGDITGAAKGFFKEGSKGYEALQRAEQVFRAFELASAAKSLAAKLFGIQTSTAATVGSVPIVVAAEGAKATASGTAAAASSMVGIPFPGNLAALAATVAALAGLGVLLKGGGGGGGGGYTPTAASQGKGTVFGDSDAESESVTNSLDLLSDLADKQLGVSQSQLQTLRAIEQGFNSTASAVARAIEASSIDNIQRIDVAPGQTIGGVASGGLSGSFARDPTSREFFDAIFGGDGTAALRARLSEEVDTLISDSIGEVFTGLVDTITTAAGTLYIDGENLRGRIEAIGLTLDSIDLEGLNGDEIIQRINAVFSAVGDTVVGELLPGIKEFQRVGEGLYETLIRVAAETAAAVGALDKIGNSFGQSSAGLEQARISEQLIELAGGIDNFADNVTGFIDTFLSEAEKSAQLRADLTAEFADLGMALPATRDGVRDIVRGIDVTTESGRQAFTTLTALNGELGKFYDELEQREKERQDLLGSVTDQIEELTTPADQLARLRLDREFEKLRAEAARLNLDSTVIDQLYNLKRAALEAGGAVAGAASAVSSSVTAQFNQGVQTQITQEQLVGQDLALFNLNLQREKMLADATAAAGDLAEVERLFAIRREEIITEYREKELEAQRQAAERAASAAASAASAAASRAQQAREAAQSAAAEQARIRQEALQQELEDARRRAGLLATVQDEINNFDLTGVALELQNLSRDFDARRQEFRDAGIIDVSLLDQLEALKRASILAAQALQQANFAQGIREQIEDLTLTGLDLDLVKLEREFADLRAQAAEIGVGTDLVDQLYALKRSAIEATEATRLQTEANEAAALPGRRADFLDGLRVRLETPSLTGQAKELLDLENSIADLRTQAAELGLTDVVLIEQIYQQERAAILQSYVDRAREIEERAQADRLNQLRAAYDREAGVLQATVDRINGITADLRSFRSQLFGADVSRATPEQRYNDLRAQLDALSPLASLGDETALSQVRELGQQFIDASQAVNSSSAAFFADRDYLASLVDSAIGGAQIERDLAQEQLDLLTEQVSALISIEEAVVSVAQAIANLNGGALPAPAAFATGGAFSNGVVSRPTLFPLGLMGEAGPEAILPLSRNADGSLGVRSSGGGGDAEQLKELQKQTRHLEAQVRVGQTGTVEILAALGRIEERMENLEENARHAESAR